MAKATAVAAASENRMTWCAIWRILHPAHRGSLSRAFSSGWRREAGSSPAASGHAERADLRRVAGRVLLQVVADVPDRAVVRRIDGGRRVVFPAQRVHLRR